MNILLFLLFFSGIHAVELIQHSVKISDSITITTNQSPAAGDACTSGELAWDADYLYVCTATGAWKRSALTGGY